MKKIKILIYFFYALFLFNLTSNIYCLDQEINIIILLDKVQDENLAKKSKKFGGLTLYEAITIDQEQIAIIQNPLIRALIILAEANVKNAKKTLTSLIENFTILATEDKNFGIIIPNKIANLFSNTKDLLTKLEFNENLIKIENTKDAIKKAFKTRYKTINIQKLNNIFSNEPKGKKIKKRIVLFGHGGKNIIAQLSKKQYISFLKRLININCDFLYIVSCFSGGWNQLNMHQIQTNTAQNKAILKNIYLPFPVVTGSTGDMPAILYKKINFNSFFTNLDTLLTKNFDNYFKKAPLANKRKWRILKGIPKNKQVKWTLKKPWLGLRPLGKVIKYIAGDNLQNIPIIKLPGWEYTVMPELDDKTEIITHKKLLRAEIEKKAFFEIGSNIKNIILRTGIISLPIKIDAPKINFQNISAYKYPNIFSTIPGMAHHFINKISIPAKSIYNFMSFLASFSHEKDLFKRLFFIKNLEIIFDYKYEYFENFKINKKIDKISLTDVTIKTYPEKKKIQREFIFKIEDKYFKFKNLQDPNQPITKEQAKQEIIKWAKETKPTKEALKNSTIFETEQKFEKVFQKSLNK